MAIPMSKGHPYERDPYSWEPKSKVHTPVTPPDPFKLLINGFAPWSIGFTEHVRFLKELSEERINSSYPPYDIIDEKNDKYRIEMAVAGFKKEDIDITLKDSVITVKGSRKSGDTESYLHRGIAARDFEQKFAIAEHVKVVDAKMSDGCLTVYLELELPEHQKARTIEIQ